MPIAITTEPDRGGLFPGAGLSPAVREEVGDLAGGVVFKALEQVDVRRQRAGRSST